ncbi:MAG TPA: dihydroorotate dehydrogenase [Clostridiales bacterium]|nr:MAG: dihydroorotate dehydrogenase B catalytic subunit [Clostridiales bacterium GWD2_32_59]HAN10093.1 dihydroorotate dehydrogenase [Clostridiales bacterium]
MIDMGVSIAGIKLRNPVMPASGTFGSGYEMSQVMDIHKLGAVVTKGVSMVPWKGNPTPRIAETTSGMLNSIGLQNSGVEEFIKYDIKSLQEYREKGGVVIVNVAGHTIQEYVEVVERLCEEKIDMIELNISCPNVAEGGVAFGTNPTVAENVVREVKKVCTRPLIVKLTPNVTDIVTIAKAVEVGGADAISLINTLIGAKIDIEKRAFVIAKNYGGLSGPAIKPVAVKMVHQVAQNTKLPIIGLGGIMTAEDAIEFIMAGATAVAVGTATFANVGALENIIDGMNTWCDNHNIVNLSEIKGVV